MNKAPSQEVMLQYPAAGCVIGEPQIAAPSQEPIGEVVAGIGTMRKVKWYSGLLPESGSILYAHPSDAAAQIAELREFHQQLIAENKVMCVKLENQAAYVFTLQAEAKTLATANYDNQCELQARITQLQAAIEVANHNCDAEERLHEQTKAAARMAYDVLGLIKLNTPPSKLVDECLVKLRDALKEGK